MSSTKILPHLHPRLPLKVWNVTATANFGIEIDLKALAEATNGKYNKRKFPNVIIYSWDPQCTIAVFKPGTMLTTGSMSEYDSKISVYLLLYNVLHKRLGMLSARVLNYEVVNCVGKFSTGHYVNLDKIKEQYPNDTQYSPKTFGGLCLDVNEYKVRFTIYYTGNINIAGARNLNILQQAYESTKDFSKFAMTEEEAKTWISTRMIYQADKKPKKKKKRKLNSPPMVSNTVAVVNLPPLPSVDDLSFFGEHDVSVDDVDWQ